MTTQRTTLPRDLLAALDRELTDACNASTQLNTQHHLHAARELVARLRGAVVVVDEHQDAGDVDRAELAAALAELVAADASLRGARHHRAYVEHGLDLLDDGHASQRACRAAVDRYRTAVGALARLAGVDVAELAAVETIAYTGQARR